MKNLCALVKLSFFLYTSVKTNMWTYLYKGSFRDINKKYNKTKKSNNNIYSSLTLTLFIAN